MGANSMTPPLEPSSPHDGGIRKRVCKACDRCRLKKSKCDGASPCSRCKADNAICVFGERKKSHDKVYPKGYVEMLENQQAQLVSGLQELYKRVQNGQGWTGSPLKDSTHGVPLTHDILERLGALKQEGLNSSETFEEDLSMLQQRLIASGAMMMHREPSLDGGSESDHSASYDHMSHRPVLTNPFTLNQLPPTPPSQSPFPQFSRDMQQGKQQALQQAAVNQSILNWSTHMADYDESIDFMDQFESPMMDTSMDMNMFDPSAFQGHLSTAAINPCLTMKDWAGQEDLQRYFNPTML